MWLRQQPAHAEARTTFAAARGPNVFVAPGPRLALGTLGGPFAKDAPTEKYRNAPPAVCCVQLTIFATQDLLTLKFHQPG